MMEPLTPNKLLDNLNNNFGKVVGEALEGYYTCWKAEKDIIETLKDLNTINADELSIVGDTILHGKSFFASEVIKHLTEMDNLKTYVNIVLSYNNTKNDNVQRGGDTVQRGGLPGIYQSIFALIAGLTMNTYDNAAALALEMSITPPGQNVAIYSAVGGEFPRAKPSFTGSLDATNPVQMEEFSKQFRTDPFPQDTSQSINMNELFRDDFVEKLNMDIITSYFTPESQLSSQFSAAVEGKVKQVNKIIEDVHTSLETMCDKFVQVRDQQLPIRLFELFNDEYDRNQRRVEEVVTEAVAVTTEELTTKALVQKGITQPEPGIIEKTANTLPQISHFGAQISQLGKMFIFGSNNENPTGTLSVNELTQVYDSVHADVSQHIEEVKPIIIEHATQQVLGDAMKEFADTVQESTDKSNSIVYFSEVCTIQKPYYSYDKKNGILTIINPARSRFHLMILVRNVMDYYAKVSTEGVSTFNQKTGLVESNVPDTSRKHNLLSLYEKAQTIQSVLSDYDRNMKKHLTEGTAMANGDLNEFFEFLINTWSHLKDPIKRATQNFPVTNEREELERSRSTEEFINAMKQKGFEDEQAITLKMKELELKKIQNTLTSEELEIWDKYVQLKINLVLNPIKGTVNSLLNTTADILVTGSEGVGKVVDSGIGSITRSVYSIAWAGMALIIPLMLGSCVLGCGPCGTFFAFIIPTKKRRKVTSRKSNKQQPIIEQLPPSPPPAPPVQQLSPVAEASPSFSPPPPPNQGFSSYSGSQPGFGSLSNNSIIGFLPSNMFFSSKHFKHYRTREDSSDDEEEINDGNLTTFQEDTNSRNLRSDNDLTTRFGKFGVGGENRLKRKPKKTRRNKKKAKQTKKYKSNNKKKHTKIRKPRYTKKH